MNPRLHFFTEFCKLMGRLGTATGNGDTPAFLGIVRLIRNLCNTAEAAFTFHVRDPDGFESPDEEL